MGKRKSLFWLYSSFFLLLVLSPISVSSLWGSENIQELQNGSPILSDNLNPFLQGFQNWAKLSEISKDKQEQLLLELQTQLNLMEKLKNVLMMQKETIKQQEITINKQLSSLKNSENEMRNLQERLNNLNQAIDKVEIEKNRLLTDLRTAESHFSELQKEMIQELRKKDMDTLTWKIITGVTISVSVVTLVSITTIIITKK